MVLKKPILPLALIASLAIAIPAGTAAAEPAEPVAQAAGGDAPPLNPSVVGVPIMRTQTALDNAADAVDEGQGATAAGPLRASRKYLIRSYQGAKYLIANMPPPEAEEARVGARKFPGSRVASFAPRAGTQARRAADSGACQPGRRGRSSVRRRADGGLQRVTSQYSAATTAVGMLPDTTGNLLNRVKTTLNTAIILRNRLVQIIAAASPPAAEEAQAAQDADDVTTFDMVMPGLAVLLGDEIQQMQAATQDTTIPAAPRTALAAALAADQQILTRVNTLWPPVTED